MSRADHRRAAVDDSTAAATRTALVRFVALSVVTLLLLTLGAVIVGERIAKQWAIDDARLRGAAVANAIAGSLVDDQGARREPGGARPPRHRAARRDGERRHRAREAVDARRGWCCGRTRTWSTASASRSTPTSSGCSEPRGVTAELSTLDKAENTAERDEGELLEVYAGTVDAVGAPLVVEAYLTTQQLRAQQRTLLLTLLALAVGMLIAYFLVVVPLAVNLARRVERGQEHHAQVLRRSLLATHRERLRIAHDLHDGVVQDLAGLRYAMPLVANQLPPTPDASLARETVADAYAMLGRDIEALRSLIMDIHPPDLEGPGLAEAAQRPRHPGGVGGHHGRPRRADRPGLVAWAPHGWSTGCCRRACATSSRTRGPTGPPSPSAAGTTRCTSR